ncbi:MAG: sigma-70 family RNA polymerase sigma factor [Thermoanaerobaculia bacterium]
MGSGFATTQWSQVLAARDGSESEARTALAVLFEAYWYPLYAFVRHQGHSPEEAADLTQAFFAYLLEKDVLKSVDPAEGKFRSFLLATLKHFLSHERDKAHAQKRGGDQIGISLDAKLAESRYGYEPSDGLTPEQVYERRWALTVLERTLGKLEEKESTGGDATRFEKLRPYLVGEEPHLPYREVAEELDMSEGAVRGAVHRLRQSFGQFLRDEIAKTVAEPDQVDGEVRHLLGAVGPWEPHQA